MDENAQAKLLLLSLCLFIVFYSATIVSEATFSSTVTHL